jgi:glycosyltransferase involved in cell wall biosynthesis
MGALVEELLLAGHQVQWFVAPIDLQYPEVVRLAARGAGVIALALPPPSKTYLRMAALRRKLDGWLCRSRDLRQLVAAFDPDHIYLNQGGTWCGTMDQFYPVLEARPGRFSLICHLNHPMAVMTGRTMEQARWLAGNASRMFFNSRWTHVLAEKQIARSIAAGAYFQYPVRFSFDEPLAWPSGTVPTIAMVNRLDSLHKGIDLAIESVACLKREGVIVELTIVGRGPDEHYIRDLALWLDVGERVRFLPYTEDLASFWADQEILLLPSRYEGLAVSMMEAMGFARPVLRTPYGGCEEWIEEDVNGFVCPAAEVDLLVQTLKRALAERGRWREMGLAAHAKIKCDLNPRPARAFLDALQPEAER